MIHTKKDLLLKDLCSRLPYRVICQCDNIKTQGVLKEIGINYNMCRLYDSFTDEYENCYIFDCKPYLFPLSSMTEAQRREYLKLCKICIHNDYTEYFNSIQSIEWLYENHFDVHGLIPMGLAIDATNLNIY